MEEGRGDDSSLTVAQRAVLVELQKILMTLNQINESLQKTIALAKEGGEVRQHQESATGTGKDVFETALGEVSREGSAAP